VIHVACTGCGTFDIVGPGHPAVECTHPPDVGCRDEGVAHVLTDRTKLKHAHRDDCEPDPETGHYPLHFTFMAGVGAVDMTGA
jgi:hypothetical protein